MQRRRNEKKFCISKRFSRLRSVQEEEKEDVIEVVTDGVRRRKLGRIRRG